MAHDLFRTEYSTVDERELRSIFRPTGWYLWGEAALTCVSSIGQLILIGMAFEATGAVWLAVPWVLAAVMTLVIGVQTFRVASAYWMVVDLPDRATPANVLQILGEIRGLARLRCFSPFVVALGSAAIVSVMALVRDGSWASYAIAGVVAAVAFLMMVALVWGFWYVGRVPPRLPDRAEPGAAADGGGR